MVMICRVLCSSVSPPLTYFPPLDPGETGCQPGPGEGRTSLHILRRQRYRRLPCHVNAVREHVWSLALYATAPCFQSSTIEPYASNHPLLRPYKRRGFGYQDPITERRRPGHGRSEAQRSGADPPTALLPSMKLPTGERGA
ncbi:hypothetical protein M433DRAFT_274395 [Acidomyces richmondensis BFW]|nr:MAG: hypothetical protein FE78DRAFT_428610 [Acidomyces sp. 'richmondensis']KYG45011.1 hypothetical protein M433DRAFT_274395 [Acidomyces richmondensis BFW]